MGIFGNRKPFPLTDREVIARSLLGVRDYYERVKGVKPFNVQECLDQVLNTFKGVYREARGYRRRSDALKEEDITEMTYIYRRIEGELMEEARRQAVSRASAITARKITQMSASAVLDQAFRENGFIPEITAQCYRAKVTVTLKKRLAMTMVIPYKALNEGKLDECMDCFKRMASSIEASPYEFQVRKK